MTASIKPAKRFSIGWFIVLTSLQVCIPLYLIQTFWPAWWEWQTSTTWLEKVTVFIGMAFFLCNFEWFFHRYFLHRISWMTKAHRKHHGLCFLRKVPERDEMGRVILVRYDSKYPIEEPEQYDSSSFPWYAVSAFCALFSLVVLWPLQLLLPSLPWLLVGNATVVFALSGYEILHAINHLPYKHWKWLTEHKVFGPVACMVYSNHELHHLDIDWNENVFGFFMIPLADLIWGTYCRPVNLILHGNMATLDDYVKPHPRPVVLWMDKRAKAIESWINHRPKKAA